MVFFIIGGFVGFVVAGHLTDLFRVRYPDKEILMFGAGAVFGLIGAGVDLTLAVSYGKTMPQRVFRIMR